MKHVFIVGSKGIPANYGGFETFVDELVSRKKNKSIKYHVACLNSESDIDYKGADCFTVTVPNVGPAKAVLYDLKAIKQVTQHAERENINNGILYVLACRIGPFFKHATKRLRQRGFKIYVNPDGHEWLRAKWNAAIKQYWKLSEKLMVKNADLLICDSKNIEQYIKDEYKQYAPKTTFISYGADTTKSTLKDTDQDLAKWYDTFGLKKGNYYLVVGRFVPENNYETIIREFMKSKTKRDLVLVTNVEHNKFYNQLLESTNFSQDPRIKFVGTVYNKELIKKIRELSYTYLHGHSVGGTNPSLLEALASTNINILYDCGFNREVAENGALYFSKQNGDLARLIDSTDKLSASQNQQLSQNARSRIESEYSWDKIIEEYENVFLGNAKTRILYLHAGADLYGSDRILLSIVGNLDTTVFEPIVVLPNNGPLVDKLQAINVRTEIIPYPIIRRKYFNLKGITSFTWSFLRSRKQLCNFAKKEQIDIVHNNTIAVIEGISLKKKLGIKLVSHVHEMLENPKIVAKFLYKIHIKHCDKMIVVSGAVKNHIKSTIKLTGNKITVLHNGIGSPSKKQSVTTSKLYKELNLPETAKVTALVGRINAIKGQDDFIESLSKIIKTNKNIYGLIIGDAFDGQEWRIDKLKQDIKNKNLQNNVIYCGFRDNMEEVYQILDLLILSSIKYDSFPTVVLEAMSRGIPTVAYKCGGVEEMIKDGYNGYLVEQGDINALSQNIERILSDSTSLIAMQKNAKQYFNDNFTLTAFMDMLQTQYEDILK